MFAGLIFDEEVEKDCLMAYKKCYCILVRKPTYIREERRLNSTFSHFLAVGRVGRGEDGWIEWKKKTGLHAKAKTSQMQK